MGVSIKNVKIEPFEMYILHCGSIMITRELHEEAIYIKANGDLAFDEIEKPDKVIKKLNRKDINIEVSL